jgi:hypothetical protein
MHQPKSVPPSLCRQKEIHWLRASYTQGNRQGPTRGKMFAETTLRGVTQIMESKLYIFYGVTAFEYFMVILLCVL